jgi:hypothetical protein
MITVVHAAIHVVKERHVRMTNVNVQNAKMLAMANVLTSVLKDRKGVLKVNAG